MVLPALGLFAVTALGVVQVWMILAVVFLRGCVNTVDNPARQTLVAELVGRDRLPSGVSLNSTIINGARLIGPALAGIVIASTGVGVCFLLNGLSFLAVIVALWAIDPRELHRSAPVERGPGQLRAAFAHVWSVPDLRVPLLLMAVVGTLAFNFQVILPLLARQAFDGGAGTYAALTAAQGVGALTGAFAVASLRPSRRLSAVSAAVLGVLILAVAAAPTFEL